VLPIRVRLTICELLEAVSVIFRTPFTVPPIVSEKVRVPAQLLAIGQMPSMRTGVDRAPDYTRESYLGRIDD
jgi:hypothetical protein